MNTTTMIPVLGVEHAFRVFGDGPVQAVVLTALGSLQAEWWPFCESISGRAAVLTYDRAGYGQSQAAQAPRTPGNIVLELKTLLDALGVTGPVTLVGHSQ
ncbi:MAG: alpha/beta fold hydrolase, partial [Spirochaetota bacterium]